MALFFQCVPFNLYPLQFFVYRKKRKHLATEKLSSISTQSILIAEESEGVDAEMSTQW